MVIYHVLSAILLNRKYYSLYKITQKRMGLKEKYGGCTNFVVAPESEVNSKKVISLCYPQN